MLSFTFTHNHFLISPKTLQNLTPQIFPASAKPAKKNKELFFEASLHLVLPNKRNLCCDFGGGFIRMCKKQWENEGNLELEAGILEFMKTSENPEAFPSKKQLVDAGRMDLVEGILKQGGWLASGWDLDESENEVENDGVDWDLRTKDKEYGNGLHKDSILEDVSHASSSGRSLEKAAEDDSGIEGILYRLEKERNINFGIGLREKENNHHVQSSDVEIDWLAKTSSNAIVAGIQREIKPASLDSKNGTINVSGAELVHSTSFSNTDCFKSSLKPDTWRTWSIQRAGISNMEFEAGEIASNETRTGGEPDALGDETLQVREGPSASLNGGKECSHEGINHGQIQRRLQQLELELSSVLQRLKNTGESVSQKDKEYTTDDILKLSDAWEFQENEIMNAQDKLRSLRAKLAVLEGKMALAIIDAQKMVEEKQKRIDDARRASRLLHTACIVWTNSASEVLLAGSFDGWNTQRKMEKSSTGIFSLYLKLYPGRYEIKFIVDGEWRIDPLRPIVHNNGYENNLLIIT